MSQQLPPPDVDGLYIQIEKGLADNGKLQVGADITRGAYCAFERVAIQSYFFLNDYANYERSGVKPDVKLVRIIEALDDGLKHIEELAALMRLSTTWTSKMAEVNAVIWDVFFAWTKDVDWLSALALSP